ncbi:YbjN domain-containing protein [Tsuneonella sp. HG094]
MRAGILGPLMVAGAVLAAPATAADTVTAYNPGGVATADAGYKATIDVDDYGDPIINTEWGGYTGAVYFYGCDEATHDRCESVQLRSGFDRKNPLPLTTLNEVVTKYRYTAMWLDKDGDPWVNFDLFTGSGIPKDVFTTAVKAYVDKLSTIADAVFADERK